MEARGPQRLVTYCESLLGHKTLGQIDRGVENKWLLKGLGGSKFFWPECPSVHKVKQCEFNSIDASSSGSSVPRVYTALSSVLARWEEG